MFDIENLMRLGVFNQLIPIWQVFFFIASLLPFLLWDRVKICLLITYLFTYYLGFMVQFGDYLSANGSMQPFVLYSLSGLALQYSSSPRSSTKNLKIPKCAGSVTVPGNPKRKAKMPGAGMPSQWR